VGGDEIDSINMITNFDQELDDDINVHYNSADVSIHGHSYKGKLSGTVRNRKTKFGSFQSVL
jgi:hypothetical protein